MPAVGKVLESPGAGGAFRDGDVMGLDRVEDAAAVQHRVGRLVRIGVALDDMALHVLELPVEVAFELLPRRSPDQIGWFGAMEVRVSPGEPVRPIDCP